MPAQPPEDGLVSLATALASGENQTAVNQGGTR